MRCCYELPIASWVFVYLAVRLNTIYAEHTSLKSIDCVSYPIKPNPGPSSFFLGNSTRKLAAISVVRKALTLAALKSAPIRIGDNGRRSKKGRMSNKERNEDESRNTVHNGRAHNDSSSSYGIAYPTLRRDSDELASHFGKITYRSENNLLPTSNVQDAKRPGEKRRQDIGIGGGRFRKGTDTEISRDKEGTKRKRKKSRDRSRPSEQLEKAMMAAEVIKKELDRQAAVQDEFRKQIALQQQYIDGQEQRFRSISNAVGQPYGATADATEQFKQYKH